MVAFAAMADYIRTGREEGMIKSLLAHPLTRGMDIDDPNTTSLRRRIIMEKKFLRDIYDEWYAMIIETLPQRPGPVLEIGSGGGFLSEKLPDLITSEIFRCDNIRVVLSGTQLPFADESLRAIVMTDVLHHIPDIRAFFNEATRCLKPGGKIIMIEPWATRWSKLIYTYLHHEPFLPLSRRWELPKSGPLSGANGALPWIVFERDRAQFFREYPNWRIDKLQLMMPFRYLLSGGVSLKSLMPGRATKFWRNVEQALRPWMKHWAMFAFIVLTKQD